MSETKGGKLLAFASVAEIVTGVALVVFPRIVVMLLLGFTLPAEGAPLSRVAGFAMLALGIACWPSSPRAAGDAPAIRGLFVYNALVALYLAYLGTIRHLGGLLLWPAVALHAVVALLLVRAWRGDRPTDAGRA